LHHGLDAEPLAARSLQVGEPELSTKYVEAVAI